MTAVTSQDVAQPIAGSRRELPAALVRLVQGDVSESAWVRPAQIAVTLVAAVVYLVNLTVSGYANTYYSAAALAASQSWSAWFFGSFDAANFITVDKPPLATMFMGLSVRLLGLSSWSILLPEALAGIATVALLFVVVRRTFGSSAAVIASLVAVLTPAAVLMFRYNNPDALLTLLLVGAAVAFIRALETGRLRWVILAAVLVGLAFNTKYLQAYLVLPAFGLTYLVAAAGGIRQRIGGLLVAGVTVLVSSLWWVAVVELLPAGSRPYIGGSTSNSAVELLLGYDGLQRIFGFLGDGFRSAGPIGPAAGAGGGGAGGFSGAAGLLRLFNEQFGGQVAWLIPFALIGLMSGLWLRRRVPRTDMKRAGYLMWGTWLLTHIAVFSFMSGIIHTYYAVAMAPAIGALVGGGLVELWALAKRHDVQPVATEDVPHLATEDMPQVTTEHVPQIAHAGRLARFLRPALFVRLALAGAIAGTAALAWFILGRTPDFAPGLAIALLAVGSHRARRCARTS
jgi:4-amino-4-deoxy-L-arabinose transferase-like glycosyltransferase